MIRALHREAATAAFSLIEIVVSLTILAVIAAVAIPTMKGLDSDAKVRAPIETLTEMVQEVRERAVHDGRPYQIVFEREGIHASRALFPYERRDEFLKYFEEMQTPPRTEAVTREMPERVEVAREPVANGRLTAERKTEKSDEPPNWEPPWTQTIAFEPEMTCEVLMWGDGEWDDIEGEKMRRWTFQPTGMANPARVRLHTKAADLEAGFDLLTGEPVGERTHLAEVKP